jgi:hypothetical protein
MAVGGIDECPIHQPNTAHAQYFQMALKDIPAGISCSEKTISNCVDA